jgi:hypothetical protein
LAPRRGSNARNTASATSQSRSVIVVDMPILQIRQHSINQIEFKGEIP